MVVVLQTPVTTCDLNETSTTSQRKHRYKPTTLTHRRWWKLFGYRIHQQLLCLLDGTGVINRISHPTSPHLPPQPSLSSSRLSSLFSSLFSSLLFSSLLFSSLLFSSLLFSSL